MSFDDFCKCDFDEFRSVCDAWAELRDGEDRNSWERARTAAALCVQPHIRRRMTPQQLVPLPWDRKKKEKEKRAAPAVSAAEQRQRLRELEKRLGTE